MMFQVKLCLTFLNMLYVEFFRASWKFHTSTHNGVGFEWLYPPRLGTWHTMVWVSYDCTLPDWVLRTTRQNTGVWILLSSIFIAIYRDKTRENLYADLFRPKNNSTISLPSTPPFKLHLNTEDRIHISVFEREEGVDCKRVFLLFCRIWRKRERRFEGAL